MGIYSTEEETAFIARKAHERKIKTVGFGVNVRSLKLGYYVQDILQRQNGR